MNYEFDVPAMASPAPIPVHASNARLRSALTATAMLTLVAVSACSDKQAVSAPASPPATPPAPAARETSPAATVSTLATLEAGMESAFAVTLPAHIDIQSPARALSAPIANSPESAEKAQIRTLLNQLLSNAGNESVPRSGEFDAVQGVLGVTRIATQAEVKRLIDAPGIAPAARKALHAVNHAIYGEASRVDALQALIDASGTLPTSFLTQCLGMLLLTPDRLPFYGDLVVEAMENHFDAEVARGRIDRTLRDKAVQIWKKNAGQFGQIHEIVGAARRTTYVYSLDNLATTSAGDQALGMFLRTAVAQAWNAIADTTAAGPAPKGEFETSADYRARIEREESERRRLSSIVGSELQAKFAQQLLSTIGKQGWRMQDLMYDADNAQFNGTIRHPATGAGIQARLKAVPEDAPQIKQDFNNRLIRPVYGIELGKTLVLKGFIVEGDTFLAVAPVDWDTGIALTREESSKFATRLDAVARERQKEETARLAAEQAGAAAQQARAAAAALAEAPRRATYAQSACPQKKYTPASLFEQDPSQANAMSMDWTSKRSKALSQLAVNGEYSTLGYVLAHGSTHCYMQVLVEGMFEGTSYRARVYLGESPLN